MEPAESLDKKLTKGVDRIFVRNLVSFVKGNEVGRFFLSCFIPFNFQILLKRSSRDFIL